MKLKYSLCKSTISGAWHYWHFSFLDHEIKWCFQRKHVFQTYHYLNVLILERSIKACFLWNGVILCLVVLKYLDPMAWYQTKFSTIIPTILLENDRWKFSNIVIFVSDQTVKFFDYEKISKGGTLWILPKNQRFVIDFGFPSKIKCYIKHCLSV